MINYLFSFFFIIGIIYSIITNTNISNEMLSSSSKSIELILSILPTMCLWLGIMNIAKKSGLLDKLSKLLYPILKYLFPSIPSDSICFSYIGTNVIMNLLGLGNAATPSGLLAIKELQKLNKNKEVASNDMITLLVLNTAAITIMPTTIISLRNLYGSPNLESIIIYIIITSSVSCTIGIILTKIFNRVIK